MAQQSFDKFTCDNCDDSVTVCEEEVLFVHPDRWINLTKVIHDDDGEVAKIIAKDYCSDLCLQEALEWGGLEDEEE